MECSKAYGNNGCNLGNPIDVFKYARDQGLASGLSYPFTAVDSGKCLYNSTLKAASVSSYRRVIVKNDDFLRVILIILVYAR